MKKLFIIVITLSILGCSENASVESLTPVNNSGEISLTLEQLEKANIKFREIEERTLTTSIRTSGFVDVPPNQRVKIHSLLSGRVDEIKSLVGSTVRSGQVMATIKSLEYLQLQYSYIETNNRLDFLKEEYERNQLLAKDNITPKKDLIRVKSEYISGKAKFETIKQTLQVIGCNLNNLDKGNLTEEIQVKAPINGEVTKVEIMLGKQVNETHLLFEIVNTEHIHLELRVFESDIDKIAIGQKITLSPGQRSEVFEGEVYLISNVIDDKERFFRVHGHIENESLKIGAYINGDIITDERKSLAVQEQAVQKSDGKHWIYLLESKGKDSYQIKPVEVKLGVNSNGWVEILNAKSGWEYVSEGAYYLSSN